MGETAIHNAELGGIGLKGKVLKVVMYQTATQELGKTLSARSWRW
jgi:hypothetical protein